LSGIRRLALFGHPIIDCALAHSQLVSDGTHVFAIQPRIPRRRLAHAGLLGQAFALAVGFGGGYKRCGITRYRTVLRALPARVGGAT